MYLKDIFEIPTVVHPCKEILTVGKVALLDITFSSKKEDNFFKRLK